MSKPKKIGLLGGSFNPAHLGHKRMSLFALRALGLDEIWWLVSPQNPLKKSDDMAPLSARLKQARKIGAHKKIKVKNLESQMGTRYSIDTIARIQKKFAGHQFVWLMGSDNLAGFNRWRKWRQIARRIPIAVINRPPIGKASLKSKAGMELGVHRTTSKTALAGQKPPAWTYLTGFADKRSATQIRAKKPRKWWL